MKKKVLIVDDEKLIASRTSIILRAISYEIDTACDGKEGFEKYKSFEPDIVITDFSMPEFSGIELAKMIRNYEKETGKKPYIILATAIADTSDLGELENDGVDYLLKKPLDTRKLLNIIVNQPAYGE
ncbi:response regulator [archaeon]|nr:response regulator [archaeon]